MNTWDKCKNCGGDYGIHHYQTNQCPVGGREAPVGRKQEYKTTVFESETHYVEIIRDLEEALERAARAIINEDLSQSERAYEAGLAVKLLKQIGSSRAND